MQSLAQDENPCPWPSITDKNKRGFASLALTHTVYIPTLSHKIPKLPPANYLLLSSSPVATIVHTPSFKHHVNPLHFSISNHRRRLRTELT